MDCISPPPLSDGQLGAYIAGDADPVTTAHLAHCTYCRERARAFARINQQLAAHLYRADCPSSLVLGEYELGLLPAEQTLAIQQHLQLCPHCPRELAQLNGFLAAVAPDLEPDPLQVIGQRVRMLIAELVDRAAGLTNAGGLAPALAGLRGDAVEQLAYQAEEFQIILETQPDPTQSGRTTLLGLLLGADQPQTLVAHLRQADLPIETAPVDELGNFIFSALPAGQYDLLLSGDDVEVHIPALQL
jgi:hypothetical protein